MIEFKLLPDQRKFVDNDSKFVLGSGGVGCFAEGTLIVTSNGTKPIEKVSVGDMVKSYNETTGETEYRTVCGVHFYENDKKVIRVKLKNGQVIEATEDHLFYTKKGYVSLRKIMEEFDGKMEKDTGFW